MIYVRRGSEKGRCAEGSVMINQTVYITKLDGVEEMKSNPSMKKKNQKGVG